MAVNANKEELTSDIKNYIENYEKEVLSGKIKGFKVIKRKIEKNPSDWYKVKFKKSSLLLFSYFIRRNKKFIINLDRIIARGNFYEIEPHQEINPYLLLSLLNSSYLKYQLEFIGRSYGDGLLKIQKYELEKLPIVNPSKINIEDINKLITLGVNLSSGLKDENTIIDEIDLILEKYVGGVIKKKKEKSMRVGI